MAKYQGQCHCGRVCFDVEAEIEHLRECNCSICRRRGALIFRVAADALTLLTPLEQLNIYRWGTKTGADYVCPKCGIMPFRRPSALTKSEADAGIEPFDGWAINARCIDALDLEALPRLFISGRDLKI